MGLLIDWNSIFFRFFSLSCLKKGQMKKKPVPLSRPNSAGQKTPCEEMAMELKRKHDAVTDREIELRLHVRSKSCDPKQAKQVSTHHTH